MTKQQTEAYGDRMFILGKNAGRRELQEAIRELLDIPTNKEIDSLWEAIHDVR